MTEPLAELKRLLLKRLEGAKGRRLPSSQFQPYANDRKRVGADEAQIQAAQADLTSQGLVAEQKSGGGRSFQITPAGIEFLRTPPPLPPGYDENLLPYHKSYLLFLLLRSPERKASLGKLATRLNTKLVMRTLGFGHLAADERVVINRPLVAWLLDSLAASGEVARTEFRGMPSYQLTEAGEERLGAAEQYPTIKFTLTGKELTDLMAAARLAGMAVGESPHKPEAAHSEPVSPRPPSLNAEQVLAEFELLKQDRYAQHGMVPIHVLRQAVAEKYGAAAADHASLDPLLRELRRQRQVRLVALGNAGAASEQQIADSIPGENEIYFAIESADEHASVG